MFKEKLYFGVVYVGQDVFAEDEALKEQVYRS